MRLTDIFMLSFVPRSFNHPTKLLAWNVKNPSVHGGYTNGAQGSFREAEAPLLSAKLQLNGEHLTLSLVFLSYRASSHISHIISCQHAGHDRFAERSGFYFNRVQSFQGQQSRPASGVYMYAFW